MNRIKAYLFLPGQNRYNEDEYLSGLLNPTFYLDRKKITAFYLPLGRGEGSQLEWIAGKWMTTKEFTVENKGNRSVWELITLWKIKK